MVALEEQSRGSGGGAKPTRVIDDWASVLCRADVLRNVLERVAPNDFSRDEIDRATRWNRERYDELLAWMRGNDKVHADLDAEDDPLLLRAWQLRCGPIPGRDGRPVEYRHIALDEVQDFSPVEVRVLLDCLDERRSMTLAGDTQQHITKDSGFTSWSDFFKTLGIENTAVDTQQTAYRAADPVRPVLATLREDSHPRPVRIVPRMTRGGHDPVRRHAIEKEQDLDVRERLQTRERFRVEAIIEYDLRDLPSPEIVLCLDARSPDEGDRFDDE